MVVVRLRGNKIRSEPLTGGVKNKYSRPKITKILNVSKLGIAMKPLNNPAMLNEGIEAWNEPISG